MRLHCICCKRYVFKINIESYLYGTYYTFTITDSKFNIHKKNDFSLSCEYISTITCIHNKSI